MKCDRCGRNTERRTMSLFTHQYICDTCLQKERNHPMFEKARDTIMDEMNKGNYGFEGIGLPDDLT